MFFEGGIMKKFILTTLAFPIAILLVACGINEYISRPSDEPKEMSQSLVREIIAEGVPHILVDVRTPEEFNERHIEGSINIPLDNISGEPFIDIDALPQDKDSLILLICRSGNRTQTALKLLEQAGYTRVYNIGGIIEWFAYDNCNI